MDVHIGRRAVFDAAGKVAGYRLRFTAAEVENARPSVGSCALPQALLAEVLERGLADLVSGGLPYVDLPLGHLAGQVPVPVRAGRLVVHLREDMAGQSELRRGAGRLRAAGHRIALDDFTGSPAGLDLLREVNVVTVRAQRPAADLAELVATCRAARRDVLVEQVDTPELLAACRALGATHLSGLALERPALMRGRTLSATQATCLQLVRVLDGAEVSAAEVTRLVEQDAGLSRRLLSTANSAAVGAPRPVTGIHQALLLLGFSQIRRWALLSVVADMPPEAACAVEAALVRANMCERLAGLVREADATQAFLIGVVSSLDVLLGQPLDELLLALPLAPVAQAALRSREGPLGAVLGTVLAYEAGVLSLPPGSALPAAAARLAFVEAVRAAGRQASGRAVAAA